MKEQFRLKWKKKSNGGVGTVVDSDRLGREMLFSSTLSSGPVVFFRTYGHAKTTTIWGLFNGPLHVGPV